ncbi:hypothetical protein AB0I81_40250 [Nonomuraea sp. NPDC050404]|uniref:hypothetical protein n=1 Tax=Nonomuraea sp. NPDC050404 TaxID=3155783 RepID=UPI0033FED567
MSWSGSGVMAQTHVDKWENELALDLGSESQWKAAFFGSSVTPNFTTDTAYNANTWLLANESAGVGYTAGGLAIVSTTIVASSGNMVWDFDNLQLDDSTIVAEGYLAYAPSVSNRALLAVWFGAPKETQDGTFLVTLDPAGAAVLDCTP